MRPPSPLEARAREHLRRRALAKLKLFADRWGISHAARVLLTVAQPQLLEKIRGEKEMRPRLVELLKLYAIEFSCDSDRRVTIKDAHGEVTFRDDFYGSGIQYCIGDFLEELGVSHPIPYPDRIPNTFEAELKEAGYLVDPQGAREYLSTLHPNMPTGLKYRLLGGEYNGLRKFTKPVCVREVKEKETPVYTIKRVLRAMQTEKVDTETFVSLAREGLSVVKATPHYNTICGMSTRSAARSLKIGDHSLDSIRNAHLVGQARKKKNLEIFSILCRRMI
jgi:hypothetical protein